MHLSGEMVDTVADYLTIFILIFMPIGLIYLFWMVHILPEKIAEKRGHPQADAIKTLCLLSLVFGGLLWPIAWLWAYSKPVLHQMAYGHDQVDHHGNPVMKTPAAAPLAITADATDLPLAPAGPVSIISRREGT
jgi:hypothetical protein